MEKLKMWLSVSTADEKKKMADLAHTSVPHLYHLTGGQRGASAALAGRIAEATVMMSLVNPELPVLNRMDLSDDCAECRYAQACITN